MTDEEAKALIDRAVKKWFPNLSSYDEPNVHRLSPVQKELVIELLDLMYAEADSHGLVSDKHEARDKEIREELGL